MRQLQEWVQREWVQRERDQEEWGQQEWVREEASQQSQADPARTHPDQGTVGWPEQVGVSRVGGSSAAAASGALAGNRSFLLRVRSCPPENGLTSYTRMPG